MWLNLLQILLAGLLVLALIFPLEHALGRIFEADGQLEAATSYYKKWIAKHPEDYESRWHTAELLLATVNPEGARQEMESMARDWPEDTRVLARLVEIEDSLLRVKEVIPRLEALAKVAPDDPEVLTRLSDHYRWFGDTEKLIETLGHLVRLRDLPDERAEFMEILLANRRYDELIVFYKSNMESMPNQLEARLALYEAYVRTGRVDSAVKELEIALSIDPSRVEVVEELRDQLVELGRWQEAIDLYKGRLATDPGNRILRAELSEMYQISADALSATGQSEAALAQFRERIALSPNSLELRLEYAAMHPATLENSVAITEIESLLKRSPANPAALAALAERYSWDNRPTEAAAAYRRLFEASPADTKIQRALANHLLWAEEKDEALVQFRDLVNAKSGTIADRVALVELLLDQERALEAYPYVRPLLSSPTLGNRLLFAEAASGAGHCDEAIPQLQWITQHNPKHAEAWTSLYECATSEKDPALALAALRVVQSLRKKAP